MLATAPVNGSQAALYAYAESELGIFPNVAGNAWPELKDSLLRIAAEKVAPLPFVPAGWLDQVKAIAAKGYAPVVQLPYVAKPEGMANPNMPAWLRADAAYLAAWNTIAQASRQAVLDYSQGKIEEGRAELAQLEADAAFWDTLYRVTKAIADAPAVAVGAVADGVSYVAGGVVGSLFKSWVFWVVALGAAGFAAWRLGVLGPLAKRAAAKATGAKAG